MKHGRTDRAQGYKKNQHQKRGGYSHKRNKDDGQEGATQDKEARSVVIGEVSHRRLDNKGQKAAYAYDQTHLCQGQREFFDKHRKERTDKRDIEIADKMNKGQAKDHFYISGSGIFNHSNQ
ncbi:unnamed protein product [marine sediment metagenome]|uniref:Uncharacterized protein n=1 Tax=marine sediment metagenome TaxID=412755 RepID=X0V859_9ZZZZ